MTDNLIRVTVTGKRAKYIPGYGARQPGESFMLPVHIADNLRGQDGFKVASAPKPKEDDK